MKKICLGFLMFGLLFSGYTFSQTNTPISGIWEGTLKAGVDLPLVFKITAVNDTFSSTLDSPMQGVYNLPTSHTQVVDNTIMISVASIQGVYNGTFVNDTTIDGKWSQGMDFPLVLIKKEKPSSVKRPQHPTPPYNYFTEDVTYKNGDNSIQFAGTFSRPSGEGNFPVALLITGSGPQDRDETLMGHKPFAVIADHLTKNGIAVLRVDDRGTGKTTGNFSMATSADFAKDVHAGINYLMTRKDVDTEKVGLIGHSEGGMIAPIVASERKDLDFVILLAGPGVKISQLMTEQNNAILKSSGISATAVDSYSKFYQKMMEAIAVAKDPTVLDSEVSKLLIDWVSEADNTILTELKLDNDSVRKKHKADIINAFQTPWMRYFLSFDPQPYLKKMNTKVLALNGEKDIQVLPKSNLEGIRSSLKKSKAKNVVIKELPGLNHLFQNCTKCNVAEYAILEETFSPAALQEMTQWLNKYVK